MVILVIILNLGLAIGCFKVAYSLGRMRHQVAQFTRSLNNATVTCQQDLSQATETLLAAQQGTYTLRKGYGQRYSQWQIQRLQLQKWITFVNLGKWLRRFG